MQWTIIYVNNSKYCKQNFSLNNILYKCLFDNNRFDNVISHFQHELFQCTHCTLVLNLKMRYCLSKTVESGI